MNSRKKVFLILPVNIITVTIAISCFISCMTIGSITIYTGDHPIIPFDVYAHWSPVDSILTYHQGYDKPGRPTGIYKLNINDGSSTLLIPHGWYSRISFDGTAVLYTSFKDNAIHIYHLNTSSDSLVTSGLYPAWHPNGDSFYYVFNGSSVSGIGIWTQSLTSGLRSKVIFASPGYFHMSPSGEHIVFVQGSSTEIYQYLVTYDMNTAIMDTLLSAKELEATRLYYPSFSNDATRILYHSLNNNTALFYCIWIYTVDTGDNTLVYSGGAYATWSPDGTHILFTKDDVDYQVPGNGKLWLYSLLTGEMRQITF